MGTLQFEDQKKKSSQHTRRKSSKDTEDQDL